MLAMMLSNSGVSSAKAMVWHKGCSPRLARHAWRACNMTPVMLSYLQGMVLFMNLLVSNVRSKFFVFPLNHGMAAVIPCHDSSAQFSPRLAKLATQLRAVSTREQ